MAKKRPTPIDVLVGQNIRIWRLHRSISQTELGARLGVTFQQIQKYEHGRNRVGAARITQIAEALGVELSTLFEGVPSARGETSESSARKLLTQPMSLRLLRAFNKLENDPVREAILRLVDLLASARTR